jgi:hypothetical protein
MTASQYCFKADSTEYMRDHHILEWLQFQKFLPIHPLKCDCKENANIHQLTLQTSVLPHAQNGNKKIILITLPGCNV